MKSSAADGGAVFDNNHNAAEKNIADSNTDLNLKQVNLTVEQLMVITVQMLLCFK